MGLMIVFTCLLGARWHLSNVKEINATETKTKNQTITEYQKLNLEMDYSTWIAWANRIAYRPICSIIGSKILPVQRATGFCFCFCFLISRLGFTFGRFSYHQINISEDNQFIHLWIIFIVIVIATSFIDSCPNLNINFI